VKYDPIKNSIGAVARRSVTLRIAFYKLLGLMFLREWHVKRWLRMLLAERRERFDVYDAGSGFGQYSYYIARHFPLASIYAVDVKDDQIADCRQFFERVGLKNCRFGVEDLTAIRHENRFDFILSVDVMEHIPDDEGVFRNFFRALRPGGTLLINTPSNLGGSGAKSAEDPSFIEEHARNGYGAGEIREKLERAGFRLEKIRYTYGPWGNAAWNACIRVPMLLVNTSKAMFFVLPFYYLLTLPFVLPMMGLDYLIEPSSGTGLNVVARKVG